MRAMPMRLLCAVSVLGTTRLLLAHGGGLDSNGGHHDRKNGGYHFHRAASTSEPSAVPSRPTPPPEPTSSRSANERFADTVARYGARTTARTTPRVEAPQAARSVAGNDYSSMPHSPPPAKVQLEAKYRATFVNSTTKDIAGYDEAGDRYMFYLLNGGSIGFPKSVVEKIEPIPVVTAAAS